MHIVYIDADACPVKDEIYRVAKRYKLRVIVVANSTMNIPSSPLVEMVVRTGFGAADDWIAEIVGPGDIVITADIPLAARSVAKGAYVLDSKGRSLSDANIGDVLAVRNLHEELRQGGNIRGGPSPMTPKDRSRFLAKLDETVNAILRKFPPSAVSSNTSPT